MSLPDTMEIVTENGNVVIEADVIMTAASLGFAASDIAETGNPIQFDANH